MTSHAHRLCRSLILRQFEGKSGQFRNLESLLPLPRLFFLFVLLLLLAVPSVSSVSSATASSPSTYPKNDPTPSVLSKTSSGSVMEREASTMIKVVFSDVDGTLVHYPSNLKDSEKRQGDTDSTRNAVLFLPPSATGARGVISSRTLHQCQEIRRQQGGRNSSIKLVLVSGMRTSTLLQRLPYLPRADAYCSEGGSRIFYPVTSSSSTTTTKWFRVTPVPFDGATADDLQPFFIEEDDAWRQRIVKAVGADGFVGNEIHHSVEEANSIPLKDRTGPLWEFANQLARQGYVLDTKGYAACFRINRKQQTSSIDFDALLKNHESSFVVPPELATSTNLGCIDVYPAISGKKNCCQYLAERFCGSTEALATSCVCLCDDDNDLELALACRHAYIPSISSESMAATIQRHRDHFTETSSDEFEGTAATEAALSLVLELIQSGTDYN